MKNTLKSKTLTILALVLSVCMLFGAASLIGKTQAKAEYQTEIATLVEGASVRVTDPAVTGIKFKAQLNKAQYNELYNDYGGNVNAGMIIVPTDYITTANGYTFGAFDAANLDVGSKTTVEFAEEGDYLTFTMSLVGLREANYDRDFEAIVYIEITSDEAVADAEAFGGKYYYYAERNASYARNIYEVARDVYSDRADAESKKYTEQLSDGTWATLNDDGMAIAKTFIDGVTEIVLEDGKPAAYSSEYYAAKDSVLTNDTEAYLLGEHTNVVYNGQSVTTLPYTDTTNGVTVKTITTDSTYADGAYTAVGDYPDRNGGANMNQLLAVRPGYVGFEGTYGLETFVEFEFTGNNMPIVTLFADVINNQIGYQGGKGLVIINGQVVNNSGTASLQSALAVFGLNRINCHYWEKMALAYTNSGDFIQSKLDASITYRYVVGTKIVNEDVNGADGLSYDEGEEKDGVLEEVVYVVLELYNATSNDKIAEWTSALKYKTDYQVTNEQVPRYFVKSDITAGSIVAHGGLKGVDEDSNVLTSTFKLVKAPYENHIHDYYTLNTDADYHWYECSCGAASEKIAHTGGTATHTEKAECEVCGTAYGDLRANYDVDDVKFLNYASASADKIISASEGKVTVTGEAAATSNRNTVTIGLKQSTTTEFLKVDFTALQDCPDRNSLSATTALWVGVRRTETQITTDALIDGTWVIGPAANSNDFYSYYGSTAKVPSKTHINYYWTNITAGDELSFLVGIVDGAIQMTLINNTSGKVLITATVDADVVSTTGALAESGFFSIHSFASVERTISWEIISKTQADYYINGGKGVEGLTVSGNVAEWTDYDGATSYKVKVNDGEWATANTNSYTMTGLKAFNTYNVTVKAICDGFETKETTTSFQYIPSDLAFTNVDLTTAKADGELSATSGKLTITTTADSSWNPGSGAITLKQQFTDEFIKVGFTATADHVTNTLPTSLGIAIGFRRTNANTTITEYVLTPVSSNDYIYLYNTGNNSMGITSYAIEGTGWASIVEGNQYYILVGVTGTDSTGATETTDDDVNIHWMLLDENDNIIRYLVVTQANLISKFTGDSVSYKKPLAESGYFTIHNLINGERTISYEIIEAEDVFKNANYGAIALTNSGATVSWDAVDGATGYLVSVNGGAWETVDTNSYTIANATSFANYEVEVKANLGYYAATGTLSFTYTPAGISVLNMTGVSSTNGISATAGDITFTATNLSADFKNTATVVIDGDYTDQFIKVKFTALESGAGRTYMPSQTVGLGVGVRGVSTDNMYTNLSFVPYSNTNWAALFGGGYYLKHFGGIGTGETLKHWDNIVKGTEYYIVTGAVGSDYNASTETTDDDLVFYWMLLDVDNSVRVHKTITAAEIQAVRAITIANSGAFTIHSINTTESRTISYEIIDSATALGYIGL